MLGNYSLTTIGVFVGFIIFFLWLDLFTHKQDKPISLKNSAMWSAVWVAVSLAFAGYLALEYGGDKASLFLAGYFLEKSLSVDNLFVFMAVFASLGIKDAYQHRVLYYGIIGALVLRLIFISFGTTIAALSHWVLAAFGVFVLYTAYAMWKEMGKDDDEEVDYNHHWAIRLLGKVYPIWPHLSGHHFFTIQNGKRYATPLLACLCVIEVVDVMFAFDSVPAVIAVTREPYLVYTSNIFAILGLRTMYFLLSAAKRYLCHLEKAVILILVFIGTKMLLHVLSEAKVLSEAFHIAPMVSLAVVGGLLTLGILASLIWPEKEEEEEKSNA